MTSRTILTEASMSLSMRLLRSNCTFSDAIRGTSDLKAEPSKTGHLFSHQSDSTPPTWLPFINEFVSDAPLKLQNKSCSAVLFLDVVVDDQNQITRTFALAFGGGHHGLNAEAFERNFGLKVALNSIARKNLKNLDVATLDATTMQKRLQSSRKVDLRGFNLDLERDLLRLAGGMPTDKNFASSLSGRDALTMTTKTSPTAVSDKCKRAFTLFQASDYKKDYAFIDLIVPVRDRSRIETLDDLVFAEVKSLVANGTSDLHLTLPEIIDPEETNDIAYYGIGLKSGSKTPFCELAIEDYIQELADGRPAELTSMADLKATHEIRVIMNGQGDKERKRKLYECFVYEVFHDQNTYVLFSGDWYQVDGQFFRSVENDFQKLLSSTPILATTKSKNEQELIVELDADIDLLNLDKVKSSPAGAAGANLEPCDFLSRNKEFIHLKDGHGSAPISHLWNQGVVAAESFVRDATFRASMKQQALVRQRKANKTGFEAVLPHGNSKPTPADYKVIFGIMRHRYQRSKGLSLPFFSKVSLRAAATRLELMGFPVEVHLIEKI